MTKSASEGNGEISKGRIPIVILSGFLGSGKTTLLNHQLRNPGGRKLAVLVNDVGEVNIDASLVGDCLSVEAGRSDSVVELSNGCICCSSQNDFGQSILKLVEFEPDGIIVEATGIAEPAGILNSLLAPAPDGRVPSDYISVQNMVTVVDASWWEGQMKRTYEIAPKRSLMHFSDPRRPLSELLASQVECADLIVLNKVDLVADTDRDRIKAALGAINPRAEVVCAREGSLDTADIWEKARFDSAQTPRGMRCDEELSIDGSGRADGSVRHSHGEFGLSTFTYRARYPLRHDAFLSVMRRGFRGLLRAKGFFWTDKRSDRIGFLSLAGDSLRFDHLGKWYHTLLREGAMDRSQLPPTAWKAWDAVVGDRRQEIVFIGIDLDRDAIERTLSELEVSVCDAD